MDNLEKLDSIDEDLRHLFNKIEKYLIDIDFIIKENDLDIKMSLYDIRGILRSKFSSLQAEIRERKEKRLEEL